MVKVRGYCALLILLLIISCTLISCNFKSQKEDGLGFNAKDNIKLNNLLSTFKLQDEERSAVEHIRSVVTDPGIVGHSIDRTYADSEFYNLLVSLGDSRLKKIIAVHLKNVKARDEALKVIESVDRDESIRQLKDRLDVQKSFYLRELKQVFGSAIPNKVYLQAMNIDYVNSFDKIKNEARGILKFENLYMRLSYDNKGVVEHIRRAVIDPSIGKKEGYKAYTDFEFELVLGSLDNLRLREIIGVHFEMLGELKQAQNVINDIKGAVSKRDLQQELDVLNNTYLLHVKWIFNKFTPAKLYDEVIINRHKDDFIAIKNKALVIKAAEQGNP
ncbi:Hypothetical protein BHY_1135 (plasmid) [Borrelia nietonii YOR]|uniref:Lipoprotein n=2 Tax=Borrelia TaxID=138 RepID=W5SG22_9SPIR|nr:MULTISPECIES: hypothetical protein [Borrelia]AHH04086.1 Hypothetical protein BHY_1135 [Borrelia nietonii YOR]AHH14641.1 Hypothetical protein BHW_0005000 [Borrelia hermsii MTW]UPA09906.1 hypothetical protein bhYOR_001221 [Borrelia nietonii YOR]